MKRVLDKIKSQLAPYNATLVAVSKTKSHADIMELYNLGQRVFGENRVKELEEKHHALPDDIQWHMIGHLQKNKVKYIIPFVECIHSVDNSELLDVINRLAAKYNKTQKVLLQIKIATEESKYGLTEEELHAILERYISNQYPNVIIAGLMGMATFTDNHSQVRAEFQKLKSIQAAAIEKYISTQLQLSEISMGMSGDFDIALEEGSTMVRIGSLLFGRRN